MYDFEFVTKKKMTIKYKFNNQQQNWRKIFFCLKPEISITDKSYIYEYEEWKLLQIAINNNKMICIKKESEKKN